MWVWPQGWEIPLEKEMATHSSILAWKILWTKEAGRSQSMGSQRFGHNWATKPQLLWPLNLQMIKSHSTLCIMASAFSYTTNCMDHVLNLQSMVCWISGCGIWGYWGQIIYLLKNNCVLVDLHSSNPCCSRVSCI